MAVRRYHPYLRNHTFRLGIVACLSFNVVLQFCGRRNTSSRSLSKFVAGRLLFFLYAIGNGVESRLVSLYQLRWYLRCHFVNNKVVVLCFEHFKRSCRAWHQLVISSRSSAIRRQYAWRWPVYVDHFDSLEGSLTPGFLVKVTLITCSLLCQCSTNVVGIMASFTSIRFCRTTGFFALSRSEGGAVGLIVVLGTGGCLERINENGVSAVER